MTSDTGKQVSNMHPAGSAEPRQSEQLDPQQALLMNERWRDWLSRWRLRGRDNNGPGSGPGSGFESQRYLTKWLLLSSLIGAVAGLGAVVFYLTIHWATQYFLGTLVGYTPPSPTGEGTTTLTSIARPWLLPLVTGVGALAL